MIIQKINQIRAIIRAINCEIESVIYTFFTFLRSETYRKESSRSSVWVFLSAERPGGNSSIVTFSKKPYE